jgi:hypothetical protein
MGIRDTDNPHWQGNAWLSRASSMKVLNEGTFEQLEQVGRTLAASLQRTVQLPSTFQHEAFPALKRCSTYANGKSTP